jgi:hypothetical protein
MRADRAGLLFPLRHRPSKTGSPSKATSTGGPASTGISQSGGASASVATSPFVALIGSAAAMVVSAGVTFLL